MSPSTLVPSAASSPTKIFVRSDWLCFASVEKMERVAVLASAPVMPLTIDAVFVASESRAAPDLTIVAAAANSAELVSPPASMTAIGS